MIPDYMFLFANHLWQSTVFVVVVWATTLALRKNRAAVRHGLWLAASLKFLVPFALLGSIGSQFQWRPPSATPARSVTRFVGTVSEPFSASLPTLVQPASILAAPSLPPPQASRLPDLLVGVWLLGVVTSLLWWYLRWRRVRRMVRLATPANLKGPLRVVNGPEAFEPGVFGIFRPVLLLPEGIADRLSPEQLQAVLAHELSHVQRRDNLTMAMHMFVEALFWFHPAVWWIKSRLLDEQERACDEEVLRLGSEPMAYAESLLKVCEFYVESPLPCVSGMTGSDLKERVGRIMRNQVGETLNRRRKVALIAIGITASAIPIVVGMVSASPIQAQVAATQIRPQASPNQIRPATSQTPNPTEATQNAVRPADIPKWEVVSIRPCPEDTPPDFSPGPRGGGGPVTRPPTPFVFSADRMTLNCRPVRFLIRSAYRTYLEPGLPGSNPLEDVLIGMGTRKTPTDGPEWIDLERYTIEAKAENVTTRSLMQGPMLQTILEDRFKIKVHWEQRETEIYALVVAKGGPKLKPFQEGSCVPSPPGSFSSLMTGLEERPQPPTGKRFCRWGGGIRGATGTLGYGGEGFTMEEFVRFFLDRTALPFVIDKTGITGKFDIDLEWRLDDAARQRMLDSGFPMPESSAPDLFKAVEEQLGMKLEKTKGPVEFHVIDHIERPSPN